jgi:hypothetical protein
MLLRFLPVALACLAVVACGDQTGNKAPIIDSVETPLVVSEANGSYTIPVTVLFHDNDHEAVTHVHYQLAPGVEGTVEVAAPNAARQSADVRIVIPATAHTDGRTRTLLLTLLDGRGAESLPQASQVTLD